MCWLVYRAINVVLSVVLSRKLTNECVVAVCYAMCCVVLLCAVETDPSAFLDMMDGGEMMMESSEEEA